MMKGRVITVKKLILLTLLLIFAAACGTDTQTPPPPDVSEKPAGMAGDAAEPETDASGSDVSAPYPFVYKGYAIIAGRDAAPVAEAIGAPKDVFEAPSCAFEGQGMDKIFYYSGFEIYTWPRDGADYIASVILTDDSVSTGKGVRLGMSLGDVTDAYGGGYQSASGLYTYKTEKSSLSFLIEDGEVAAITYSYDNL